MELTPAKLVTICAGLFAGVVALNFVAQYRSNEQFKEKLTGLGLDGLRSRLQREEGITSDIPEMEQPATWPTADLTEISEEG